LAGSKEKSEEIAGKKVIHGGVYLACEHRFQGGKDRLKKGIIDTQVEKKKKKPFGQNGHG